MSLLNRAPGAPKPTMNPDPPPRSCVVCTEQLSQDGQSLVRPCRTCATDYCKDCLIEMFVAATNDSTRMPPRCCSFLQIHTAYLNDKDAKAYRTRFEEWITMDKTYCPAPTCSTFIPERLLPAKDGPKTISLQSFLAEIIEKVVSSPPARFFRGELPITELPGYAAVVPNPMDLTTIQARAGIYKSTMDLTSDMQLIVSNAKTYNGPNHPVAKTADELFARYVEELSAATDGLLVLAGDTVARDHFICPKCHIGICAKCKQIEHGTSVCDTTAQDHEMAMLEQFRYKRCPLCKHAVRKMFGCSHMACVCGAHWCYYCQRSIDECDGACAERDETDDEDEDDFDDEEDDVSDTSREEGVLAVHTAPPAQSVPSRSTIQPSVESIATPAPAPTNPPSPLVDRIRNLDAGGTRRWAEAGYDFGDEPEDTGDAQIWSCKHAFEAYKPHNDEYCHGDVTRMECNKCFEHVQPHSEAQAPGNKVRKISAKSSIQKWIKAPAKPVIPPATAGKGTETGFAWECKWCRLVVCETCRDKINASQDDE